MVDQLPTQPMQKIQVADFTAPPGSGGEPSAAARGVSLAALSTPQDIQKLLRPVRAELQRVEHRMKAMDSSVFAPLADAFVEMIGHGGKRLRPALTLLAARLAGPLRDRERHRQVVALAAAVEMLHTATLVHDDVIDGARLRRGAPTLNAIWSQGATVLAGDYMFARAACLSAETDNARVIDIFSNALRIIVDGELRQLFARNQYHQKREDYFERIYAKTASLYRAATESAAVLAGFDEERIRQISEFGYHFGMAFQIVDDILDFTGDDATLGKPAGSDLRQGTLTLPFFHYLSSLPDPNALVERLASAHEQAETGDGERMRAVVEEIVHRIRQSPAIEASRAEATDFLVRAAHHLSSFPDTPCKESLLGLCAFVVQRSS